MVQYSSNVDLLHHAVGVLVGQDFFSTAVERLREELLKSPEPFVWTTIERSVFTDELPEEIKSCWVFHLKKDTWTGSHYHPNSIQHMVAINGRGKAIVGDVRKNIHPFGSPGLLHEDVWFVIEKNVPHEFLPEGEDMTVVSFHTCEADELEEVSTGTGASRRYENE